MALCRCTSSEQVSTCPFIGHALYFSSGLKCFFFLNSFTCILFKDMVRGNPLSCCVQEVQHSISDKSKKKKKVETEFVHMNTIYSSFKVADNNEKKTIQILVPFVLTIFSKHMLYWHEKPIFVMNAGE